MNNLLNIMDNKTKILIIRLSAIGDTIHTIPLAFALKKAYPGCTVDWVVEDKAKHFVKNNPVVDNCFIIPRKKWKKRGFSLKNLIEFFIIIKNIKKKNYDIVIDTQQLLKSAIIMGLSGAKRKITTLTVENFHLFSQMSLLNQIASSLI